MKTVSQVCQEIHNILPEIFTFESMLKLFLQGGYDGDQLLSSTSNEFKDNLLDKLRLSFNSCNNCNRCSTRTNVVGYDGASNAKVFIVCMEPSKLDDRTIIPLSSLNELKQSSCVKCQGFMECYQDFEYNKSPLISCEFKPSNEVIDFSYEDAYTPINTFTKHLIKNKIKRYSEANNSSIYITNLVKCFSETLPTEEEISICRKFLEVERSIVDAEITIFLGEEVAKYVLSGYPVKVSNRLLNIGERNNIDWKKCYVFPNIEDITNEYLDILNKHLVESNKGVTIYEDV